MSPWTRAVVRAVAVALVVTVAPVAHRPAQAAPAHRLLLVGDSITHGSASDYTWRYRLAKHLSAVAPGTVDFVGDRTDLYDNINGRPGSQAYVDAGFDRQHHALWGRPVAYEKDTVAEAVRGSGATTMTVLLGINDLAWLRQTPVGLAADMERLILNARSANPDLDIVLGHILTRGNLYAKEVVDAAVVAEVNLRYDALAQRLSTTRSRIVTASTDVGWDPLRHTWDGVHPNSTGEVRIAAKFADALGLLGIGRAYGTIPDFVKWNVGGGAVTATPVDRGVALRWTATPGANAIFMEQRIVSLDEQIFTPLPVPLSGTSWTASPLPPGWVIEYRAVPMKGTMVGHGGPAARATVGGGVRPTERPDLVGIPGTTPHNARLWWTAVPNATGYMIETCELKGELRCDGGRDRWTRLPWAVPTTTFDAQLLTPGQWYSFRVVPVHGGLEGPTSNRVEIRTKGVPLYTTYFALGDSFSAGTGGAVDNIPPCWRSVDAWPRQLTASWEASPRLIACAGNTTNAVRGGQLDQVKAVNAAGATLVTVTAGGIDVGFLEALISCAAVGTGCSSRRAEFEAKIENDVKHRLVMMYNEIREALPGADIIAVGYPLLIDPDDVCLNPTELTLSRADKEMMRDLGRKLNDAIHWAASRANVHSAAYDPAFMFAGHGACAGALDWDQWIHPYVTLGLVVPVPVVYRSFHPNVPGQMAYALAVNDARVRINETGASRYPA